jgi:hypothetical protein
LEDVQRVGPRIQLEGEALSRQFARDIIWLEIHLDHAMDIDLALHMPAMQRLQPTIGIDESLAAGAEQAKSERPFVAAACHS